MERMMDNETFDEVLNSFKEADSIVKRLKTRISELEEENKNLRAYADNLDSENDNQAIEIEELKKENKNLKEFKEKRKESRFYFKAQMERAEPKTAREAEDLQRAKKLFEKLYREELGCLEEENRKLKEDIDKLQKIIWKLEG